MPNPAESERSRRRLIIRKGYKTERIVKEAGLTAFEHKVLNKIARRKQKTG